MISGFDDNRFERGSYRSSLWGVITIYSDVIQMATGTNVGSMQPLGSGVSALPFGVSLPGFPNARCRFRHAS